MAKEMFTKDEAITLLQKWGVNDVEEKLKNDRANLLNEIITAYLGKVPFQSVTFMATAPEERVQRVLRDVKKNCVNGVGGLCYTLNSFICNLLKGLGFCAWFDGATVTSTHSSPNNHLLVLVSGVERENDMYLVDCGTGFPIFRAVPLDFAEESPVYQDGFLEYKYIRHDGRILRMHGKGDVMKRNNPPIEGLDFIIGHWRRFYSFTLSQDRTRDVSAERYLETVIQTPFMTSPRALWFPNKRAVIVVNNRLMIENEDGKLEPKAVYETDDEIAKCFHGHFPALSEDEVRRALKKWQKMSTK